MGALDWFIIAATLVPMVFAFVWYLVRRESHQEAREKRHEDFQEAVVKVIKENTSAQQSTSEVLRGQTAILEEQTGVIREVAEGTTTAIEEARKTRTALYSEHNERQKEHHALELELVKQGKA